MMVDENLGADSLQRWLGEQGSSDDPVASAKGFRCRVAACFARRSRARGSGPRAHPLGGRVASASGAYRDLVAVDRYRYTSLVPREALDHRSSVVEERAHPSPVVGGAAHHPLGSSSERSERMEP